MTLDAGRLVVIAGLSATGKTTLVRRLEEASDVAVVPEHNDWIGGSQNFPKVPTTLAEKQAKQEFFLNIDLERYKWAKERVDQGRLVVCDSDFTSPLAHNYGERWMIPDMDIYPWMVERYIEHMEHGRLAPADGYVYLDATLEERSARRAADAGVRKRNDMFFGEVFPADMRRFYHALMHPDSPRRVLPAEWVAYPAPAEAQFEQIRALVLGVARRARTAADLTAIAAVLRDTVNDAPSCPPS